MTDYMVKRGVALGFITRGVQRWDVTDMIDREYYVCTPLSSSIMLALAVLYLRC